MHRAAPLLLLLACTPPAEDPPDAQTTGTAPASTSTVSASDTGAGPVPTTGDPPTTSTTAAPTPTTSSTSSTSTTSTSEAPDATSTGDPASTTTTGDPVDPACGDGVAAPGEVCFTRSEPALTCDFEISLALADLDGDGHLDLVGADAIEPPLTRAPNSQLAAGPHHPGTPRANIFLCVALGDGLGGLTDNSSVVFGEFDAPELLVPADVTGDDNLDILALAKGRLHIFAGDGAGTLEPLDNFPLPGAPKGLAVGDLSGDAVPDAVWVGDVVGLSTNDGLGGLLDHTTFAADDGPPRRLVRLLDLDGDADLDLLVARDDLLGDGAVEALRNDGGVLTHTQQVAVPGGALDLVVLADAFAGQPAVLVSNDTPALHALPLAADGTLAAPEPLPVPGAHALLSGRLDGDDRDDALTLGFTGMTALLGQPSWPPLAVPIADSALAQWSGRASGDLNEDGLRDLAIRDAPLLLFLSNP